MGKYDEPELIRAIEKSLINADDLIEDATLLKENFRFARSYALYQLAMEEAGKALFIYSTILLDKLKTKEQKIKFDKELKDHGGKANSARMMTFIWADHSSKNNFPFAQELFTKTLKEAEKAKFFNVEKNHSLYTSFREGQYRTPKEMISFDKVNYIHLMAINRVSSAKSFLKIGLPDIQELKKYIKENPMSEEERAKLINEKTKLLVEKLFLPAHAG